jgi:hypothetical protein
MGDDAGEIEQEQRRLRAELVALRADLLAALELLRRADSTLAELLAKLRAE